MQPYKVEVPFQKRQSESYRVLTKYPGRIPVIAEPAPKTVDMFKENPHVHAKNRKYLVPNDMTVGQFVYILRTRFKLKSEQAMFIFVKDVMPPTSVLMSSIYQQHADEDGFLYVSYAGENVFG